MAVDSNPMQKPCVPPSHKILAPKPLLIPTLGGTPIRMKLDLPGPLSQLQMAKLEIDLTDACGTVTLQPTEIAQVKPDPSSIWQQGIAYEIEGTAPPALHGCQLEISVTVTIGNEFRCLVSHPGDIFWFPFQQEFTNTTEAGGS